MRRLIIWGGGGHGQVVCDIARAMNVFDDVAFYDDEPSCHTGSLADLKRAGFHEFVVAIGSNAVRGKRFHEGKIAGFSPATCIHPVACIAPSVTIGPGCVIMPGAILNARATVGENCIINTGAIVEHDCSIGDHAHLSPGVTLGGGVCVGAYAHLGIAAAAIPGVQIGERSIIGAGAVIIRDLAADVTAVGIPARPIRR